ncbi:MAG: amidohydrolase, partial [Bacteroidetes bacterium HGW-Bacteroidetes-21]
EKSPGGAIAMLKEGVFDKYKPDVILAQHVFPDLPAGFAGFKAGYYMASSDEIYITVTGKGGHGALPHKLKDPLLASAHLITSMEQINSRILKAGNPSVLTFGKFIANGAVNIIPDKVEIEGTFRAMDDDWRKEVHAKIKEVCKGISLTFGVEAKLKIVGGYPSLYNNPKVTEKAHKLAQEFLPKNNAVDLEDIRMTAEDFSYFGKAYPSCMYRLGVGHTDGKATYPLHSAQFDIDEKAYETGIGLMYHMVMGFLSSKI